MEARGDAALTRALFSLCSCLCPFCLTLLLSCLFCVLCYLFLTPCLSVHLMYILLLVCLHPFLSWTPILRCPAPLSWDFRHPHPHTHSDVCTTFLICCRRYGISTSSNSLPMMCLRSPAMPSLRFAAAIVNGFVNGVCQYNESNH